MCVCVCVHACVRACMHDSKCLSVIHVYMYKAKGSKLHSAHRNNWTQHEDRLPEIINNHLLLQQMLTFFL